MLVDAELAGVEDERPGRLPQWRHVAARVGSIAALDLGQVVEVAIGPAHLGGPPRGADVGARGEVDLERGIGQDDRADVAPDHDRVAAFGGRALHPEHRRAHLGVAAHRADRAVDGRRADLERHVAAVEANGLEPVGLVRARPLDVDAALAHERAEGRAVVDVDPPLERGQGQRAVHQAGVDEGGVDPLGEGVADRALPGPGRPVDRDRPRHRGRDPDSAATSLRRRRRHSPSRRPARVSVPILTRTSRSTSLPTASKSRRTSRLRPSPMRTRSHSPRSVRLRATSRGGGAWRAESSCAEPSSSVIPERRRARAAPEGGRRDQRRVLPLVAVAGMDDAVGPLAIVGEDHQALRFDVQAPGRPEPLALGVDERHDRSPAALVVGRAEEAARLVDGEVDRSGGGAQRLSVDLDPVVRRIRGVAQTREPAVDPDATVGDELLGAAARREPGACDELLEPLTGHRWDLPARRAAPRRSTAGADPRSRSARSARGT